MKLFTWIVVCQEVVRDGRTGKETAGNLVGIRSDCEILEYASLDEAATLLAGSALEVRLEVPKEAGWERWREMPSLMKQKFSRLCEQKRKAGRGVPVGMMLAKMRPAEGADTGWSILFIAQLPVGEHAAPDLESMSDILADADGPVTRMPDGQPDGVYDLPDSWRDLLVRLIAARRMATSAIERAKR
jgi:hypothetical protein